MTVSGELAELCVTEAKAEPLKSPSQQHLKQRKYTQYEAGELQRGKIKGHSGFVKAGLNCKHTEISLGSNTLCIFAAAFRATLPQTVRSRMKGSGIKEISILHNAEFRRGSAAKFCLGLFVFIFRILEYGMRCDAKDHVFSKNLASF